MKNPSFFFMEKKTTFRRSENKFVKARRKSIIKSMVFVRKALLVNKELNLVLDSPQTSLIFLFFISRDLIDRNHESK